MYNCIYGNFIVWKSKVGANIKAISIVNFEHARVELVTN